MWNQGEMEALGTGEIPYPVFRKYIHERPLYAKYLWDECMPVETVKCWVFQAAENVHLDVLKWTLGPQDVKRRIDARALRNDDDNSTLLHCVCASNERQARQLYAALKFLIVSAGCDVNAPDCMERTPFHQICASHLKSQWKERRIYIRILRLFIERGVNVNQPVKGITPLHIVHESPWAVSFLVKQANASPDVEDPFQRTPLLWALRNIYFPAAKWFPVSVFRGRADFRKKEFMGQSVMHFVVLRAHSETLDVVTLLAKRLIDAGADINATNYHLRTPLFFLIRSPELIPLAKVMIDKFGADVNLSDADGFTVVHLAAIMGRLDYVAIFLPELHYNYVTPNGDTIRSCVESYCPPHAITRELKELLARLDQKDKVFTKRCKRETYNVWDYVHFLDQHRDLLSLYVVETFYRYRGGRTIFTDIFHHINHSVRSKERAQSFIHEITQWKGEPNALQCIIDNYSVGTIHYHQDTNCSDEPCRMARSVLEMVQELMDVVRRNNNCWLLEVVPMGSVGDGSKILIPDEFDFLIIFRRIKPEDEMESAKNLGLIENFQIALLHAMQQMDAEMLRTRRKRPLGFQFVDCELRRVGLNIRLTWLGDDPRYKHDFEGLNISVDLTPVYQLDGWQNRSGFRCLRPYGSLPDWFKNDSQIIEHFRPVHNQVVVLPCAATMEAHCLSRPNNIYLQYTLRLLKLVVQCDHILQDVTAPNSHFLKTAVLCYAQEKGLPCDMPDVASYVCTICDRFIHDFEWSKAIPNFVADAKLNNPLSSLMVKPNGRELALSTLREGLASYEHWSKESRM